jgi:hypothetical protein
VTQPSPDESRCRLPRRDPTVGRLGLDARRDACHGGCCEGLLSYRRLAMMGSKVTSEVRKRGFAVYKR